MNNAPQSSLRTARADSQEGAARPARAPRRRWSRRRGNIALGVLALGIAVFLVYSIPKYLSFDPEVGRLSPAEHPAFFPVLMTHVLGATLAISACVLQVWPWLRRRYPVVHRYVGRLYVVAGVWPAAGSALVLALVWPFGPISATSDIVLALLWLSVTTYGFVLGRQRRYRDHRRWMLRSFALTISILGNRLLGWPIWLFLSARVDTMFGGDELAMEQAASAIAVWSPWVLAFVTMELWLSYDQRRESRARAQVDLEPSGTPPATSSGTPPAPIVREDA